MRLSKTILPWGEVFLFAVISFSENGFGVKALIFCLIHELSHILVCKAVGGKFSGLRPGGAGLVISYYPSDISYVKELAIVLAGSFANFALGMILFICGTKESAYINFALGGINLLPMKGFDGGEVLYALVSCFKGDFSAYKVLQRITTVCVILLWISALYCQLRLGANLSMLLCAVYVLILWMK